MRKAILAFCLTLAATIGLGEVILFIDGVRDPVRLYSGTSVYADGVLQVAPPAGGGGDPNELPQADSILWRFGQFAEGGANGSNTNLIDYGPTGTNYGLMLNSMPYEDLQTMFAPRYKFDGTAANRLLAGWTGNMTPWNVSQIATDTSGTLSFWWSVDSDSGARKDAVMFGYQPNDNVSQLSVSFLYNTTDNIIALLYVDSVLQWDIRTPSDFLDDKIGVANKFDLIHDGTSPIMRHNGEAIANVTTNSSTDLTAWFNDMATDATSDADYLGFGFLQDSTTIKFPWASGFITDITYWPNTVLTLEESGDAYTVTSTNNGLPSYALNDPQRASLAVEYPFEYDAAADTSGNENHGTIAGATFAAANTNGYMVFDGINDTVTLADGGLDPSGNNFSVSFWAYTGDLTNAAVASKRSSGGNGWVCYTSLTDGDPQFILGDGSVTLRYDCDTGTIGLNEWHYYTMTRTGPTALQVYVDGVSASGTTTDVNNVTLSGGADTIVGRNRTTLYFDGRVDDFMYHTNVAVTLPEHGLNYTNSLSVHP